MHNTHSHPLKSIHASALFFLSFLGVYFNLADRGLLTAERGATLMYTSCILSSRRFLLIFIAATLTTEHLAISASTTSYFAADPHHVSISGHIDGLPDADGNATPESIMLHVFIAARDVGGASRNGDDDNGPTNRSAATITTTPKKTTLRGMFYAEGLDAGMVKAKRVQAPPSAIPNFRFPVTFTDPATGAKRRALVPAWQWKELWDKSNMEAQHVPLTFTVPAFDGHVPCVQVSHACILNKGLPCIHSGPSIRHACKCACKYFVMHTFIQKEEGKVEEEEEEAHTRSISPCWQHAYPYLDQYPRAPQVSVKGWQHTAMLCLDEGRTATFDNAILGAERAVAEAGGGGGGGGGGGPAVWFHIPPFRMDNGASAAGPFVSLLVHSVLFHTHVRPSRLPVY